MCMGNAVRHLMLVASHTGLPLGRPKWLERENCGGKRPAVGRRYFKIVPYLKARFFACDILLSSHFAIPIGTAVWLATDIKCLTAFPTIVTFYKNIGINLVLNGDKPYHITTKH